MRQAVIVDAVRSPMGRGKPGGSLSGVHPVDLLAQVLATLIQRTGLDPGSVDDMLVLRRAQPDPDRWPPVLDDDIGHPDSSGSATLRLPCSASLTPGSE